MAERYERFFQSTAPGELFRWAGEDQVRFAAWFPANINITPTHRFADAGPERFRNGLLGREASGQMSRRKFHGIRVLNLSFGEDAAQEPITKAVD
jgi:hypothetical protein